MGRGERGRQWKVERKWEGNRDPVNTMRMKMGRRERCGEKRDILCPLEERGREKMREK